jgi:hypothetical protein
MKDLDMGEDVVFHLKARLKTWGTDGADQLWDRTVDAALTNQTLIFSRLHTTLFSYLGI